MRSSRQAKLRLLDAYLRHGGSLVFFLGNQVLAESYNRELAGGSGNEPAGGAKEAGATKKESASAPHILPARLGRIVEHAPQTPFRLDPRDYRHPIVQVFRGRGESGLLTTPVFKHFRLETANDSAATTVLALANGDPLIVEQPVHHGRVVLVATSADTDTSWTAMPLWPSFVPLVQEIVAWSVGLPSRQ